MCLPWVQPWDGQQCADLVAIDWNDLPVHREFDDKFLENVKSPPHALPPPLPPPPFPAGLTLIGALGPVHTNAFSERIDRFTSTLPFWCVYDCPHRETFEDDRKARCDIST